jgi:hypothetical protein
MCTGVHVSRPARCVGRDCAGGRTVPRAGRTQLRRQPRCQRAVRHRSSQGRRFDRARSGGRRPHRARACRGVRTLGTHGLDHGALIDDLIGSARIRLWALLTALASVAAVVAARAALPVLLAVVPADLPRIEQAVIGGRALVYTLGVGAFVTAVCTLLPLLTLRGSPLEQALRDGGRAAGSRHNRRTRRLLVVGEMAIAVIYSDVCGAALSKRCQPDASRRRVRGRSARGDRGPRAIGADRRQDERARVLHPRHRCAWHPAVGRIGRRGRRPSVERTRRP